MPLSAMAIAKALIPRQMRPYVVRVAESARRALRRIYYLGFVHYCPFCHSHLRRMHPRGFRHAVLAEYDVVGAGPRPNGNCPVCRSYDRERLLWLYLHSETSIFRKRSRVLHIAPEPQLFGVMKSAPNLDYVSGDTDPVVAEQRIDVTAIPFEPGAFDYVICNHVLEHVPDDHLAMREIFRVLVPGGKAILQVPIARELAHTVEDPSVTDPRERERLFGQEDHVRLYGADYADRLREAGFDVEIVDYAAAIGARDVHRFGLLPDERIYSCARPA